MKLKKLEAIAKTIDGLFEEFARIQKRLKEIGGELCTEELECEENELHEELNNLEKKGQMLQAKIDKYYIKRNFLKQKKAAAAAAEQDATDESDDDEDSDTDDDADYYAATYA